AEEKKLSSIAFPCISAGVYGCPIKLSAKVAIDTIEAYLKQYKGSLTVTLACFKDSEYEAYKAYAKEINLQ
ncbi:MAG: macro domain-containing protein, partial [Succinivibrio sp.]|nr:macro domain-containing protein [Succinivibrio sp.]